MGRSQVLICLGVEPPVSSLDSYSANDTATLSANAPLQLPTPNRWSGQIVGVPAELRQIVGVHKDVPVTRHVLRELQLEEPGVRRGACLVVAREPLELSEALSAAMTSVASLRPNLCGPNSSPERGRLFCRQEMPRVRRPRVLPLFRRILAQEEGVGETDAGPLGRKAWIARPPVVVQVEIQVEEVEASEVLLATSKRSIASLATPPPNRLNLPPAI